METLKWVEKLPAETRLEEERLMIKDWPLGFQWDSSWTYDGGFCETALRL